jgi:hypothetical protein
MGRVSYSEHIRSALHPNEEPRLMRLQLRRRDSAQASSFWQDIVLVIALTLGNRGARHLSVRAKDEAGESCYGSAESTRRDCLSRSVRQAFPILCFRAPYAFQPGCHFHSILRLNCMPNASDREKCCQSMMVVARQHPVYQKCPSTIFDLNLSVVAATDEY